jgi:hypothetical protein
VLRDGRDAIALEPKEEMKKRGWSDNVALRPRLDMLCGSPSPTPLGAADASTSTSAWAA